MPDFEEFMSRPIIEHLVAYDKVADCSVRLIDIARMNNWLDVRDENMRRAQEAAKRPK
jgi:hypothetical protein